MSDAPRPSGQYRAVDGETPQPPRRRERDTRDLLIQSLQMTQKLLEERITRLEHQDAELSKAIVAVEKAQAVQTTLLTSIERGVAEIKAQRESDGTRFRHVIQLLASVAAVAVSVIAIVTR